MRDERATMLETTAEPCQDIEAECQSMQVRPLCLSLICLPLTRQQYLEEKSSPMDQNTEVAEEYHQLAAPQGTPSAIARVCSLHASCHPY